MTGPDRGTPSQRAKYRPESDDERYANSFHSAIQSLAIWGWHTKTVEVDSFSYPCHQCRSTGRHLRTQQRRFRTLFKFPLKQIGDAVDVVTCSRCGNAQHPRDLGELVVPSTVALYNEALVAANDHFSGRSNGLDDALIGLRDEASSPILERFLGEVAATVRLRGQSLDGVPAIGRQLALSERQVERAITPDD